LVLSLDNLKIYATVAQSMPYGTNSAMVAWSEPLSQIMKTLILILTSFLFLTCKSNKDKILDYKLEFISQYGKTENRKLRAITYYQENGFPKMKIEYGNTFNETPSDTGRYEIKYVFTYNNRGDLIERKYFKESKILPWSHFVFKYTYDINDLLQEKITYETLSFDNHETFSKSTKSNKFYYHDNGKLKQEVSLMNFGGNDTTVRVSNYFYDINWHLTRQEFLTEDTLFFYYNYDSILNQITFKNDGFFRLTKFDDSSNIKEITKFHPESGDTLREKFTYVKNKLLEEISYYPQIPNNQTIKKFYYNKYDSIKSIESFYGSDIQFEKREFEYYFKKRKT